MNLLKMNSKLESYVPPIIKSVVAIAIIVLVWNQNQIYQLQNPILRIVDAILALALFLVCVLRIYISFAELIAVSENRANKRLKQKDIHKVASKEYDTSYILDIIRKSEITDIIIKTTRGITHIGASSDYSNQTGKFFDKKYYIESAEYTDFKQFSTELSNAVGTSETVDVVSIDGIAEKHKHSA